MKGKSPRIMLLGSNSGNNLGDAAILSGILDAVTKVIPDAEFIVPSTKPSFTDNNYGHLYNVKGMNVMPWTGSMRLFGIPVILEMMKSDVALICDGIIFGKKFFNPAFNFLITLICLVPFAKLFNCKLICYSCGIGPFPSNISRLAAKYLLNNCDQVIMRENDSKKLAEMIGCVKAIPVTGDAAFINPVSSPEKAKEIMLKLGINTSKKLFGINVTKYIDSWLNEDERLEDKDGFLKMLSDAVKSSMQKLENEYEPVIFCTQPMDREYCEKLAKLLNCKVVDNSTYLSHDIQAVMRECDLFMGMRFHSVVLASAVETPIIGLIYAPKVRGFMRLLECEDYGLELKSLDSNILAERITAAWREKATIKARQKKHVDVLKEGARNAAKNLKERYFERTEAVERKVA